MESLPKDSILEFNKNTFEKVREMFNIHNSREMNQLIDVFEEWVKKQSHFTMKQFSRSYLERIIIMNKGSVERAKSRLDKLCTMRTLMPQYFDDYDITKDFCNVDGVFTYCALPKLTGEHERVMIIKGSGRSLVSETLPEGYRYCSMMVEYFKAHDYASSYIFVNDMRAVNLSHLLSKLGMIELRQIVTLITDGYGLRIKGVHFLTQSKMVETLVSMIKQIVNENIGKRLYVHNSMESLYESIPKQILPIDYGGDELTMEDLDIKWKNILNSNEFKYHWREMRRARTDETSRRTDCFNEQYMGLPGTFRTLSVD